MAGPPSQITLAAAFPDNGWPWGGNTMSLHLTGTDKQLLIRDMLTFSSERGRFVRVVLIFQVIPRQALKDILEYFYNCAFTRLSYGTVAVWLSVRR